MSITFHEVRWGEVDEALAFARSLGRALDAASVVPRLSLVALNDRGERLGCALYRVDRRRRPTLSVSVAPGVHPGLARLLIDRAMRKAACTGVSCARLDITPPPTDAQTWRDARWDARFPDAA